jgi:hypothetical protein
MEGCTATVSQDLSRSIFWIHCLKCDNFPSENASFMKEDKFLTGGLEKCPGKI